MITDKATKWLAQIALREAAIFLAAKLFIGFAPSIASMVVGVIIGIKNVDGPYDLAFGISIALGSATFAVVVYSFYKNAPLNSPAYVTWPAFATTVLALLVPLMSTLLWIAFTMGSIDARLDSLKP